MIDVVSIHDVKVKLGEACRALRKAHDLSREDLASVLDISRATIQNIENGKNATLDNVLKVANHFDLLSPLQKAVQETIDNQENISFY